MFPFPTFPMLSLCHHVLSLRGFSLPGGPATEKRGGAVSHHPLLLAIGAATGLVRWLGEDVGYKMVRDLYMEVKPRMGAPSNHPKLDHLSIETHGFGGPPFFRKPPYIYIYNL